MDIKEMLTREKAIQDGIDPFGTKWIVGNADEHGLVRIVSSKDLKTWKVPETYPDTILEGRFTKPDYAQRAIQVYLSTKWDWSDGQQHLKKAGDKRFKDNKGDLIDAASTSG
jgi:hypothetical protein